MDERIEMKALKILVDELQLLHEESVRRSGDYIALCQLGNTMAGLLNVIHEDWVLLAQSPEAHAVHGNKGLYIRQAPNVPQAEDK